jgi:hypothetical protein
MPTRTRILYARLLFEKAVLHGRSICSLLRQGRTSRRRLDISGACALARSLIEAHNVLLYLTEPGRSKGEYALRFELMYLNNATDLIRISEALGLANDEFFLQMKRRSLEHSTGELQKNSVFMSFDEKHRNNLLGGRTAYLTNRDRGPRPMPKKLESAAYNLFSHNVHAFGLASSHVASATPAGGLNTLFLATEFAIIYLANTARHYRSVRTRAIGQLRESELKVIGRALTRTELSHWISTFREQRGW